MQTTAAVRAEKPNEKLKEYFLRFPIREAAFFRHKTHIMRQQAVFERGACFRFLVRSEILAEIAVQQLISPAVHAEILEFLCQIDRVRFAEKGHYFDEIGFHIPFDLTVCAADMDGAMAFFCEIRHGKACRYAAFEPHHHFLMIDHIVIAMVDAAPEFIFPRA